MSHVTDIILMTAIEDGAKTKEGHPNVDKLNEYIEREHCKHKLLRVDEHSGGRKEMQCDVFMAAINYMDIDGFIEWFSIIAWEHPESVQLLIKDEHDDKFSVHLAKPNAHI